MEPRVKFAISGKICSGKSTTACQIVDMLGPQGQTRTLSFAKRLKEIAAELFDYDEKKNKNRALLQDFGAKIREVDKNAWIRALDKQVKALPSHTNVIVDDLRFVEEFTYCKQHGYITIRLEISPQIQKGRILTLYTPEHLERISNISETALDGYLAAFDYVIYVDDSVKAQHQLESIVKKHIQN